MAELTALTNQSASTSNVSKDNVYMHPEYESPLSMGDENFEKTENLYRL